MATTRPDAQKHYRKRNPAGTPGGYCPAAHSQHGAARRATLRPNWPATDRQRRTKRAEPRKQGQLATAHDAPALRNAAHVMERCPSQQASRIQRGDRPAGRLEELQKVPLPAGILGDIARQSSLARGRPPRNPPANWPATGSRRPTGKEKLRNHELSASAPSARQPSQRESAGSSQREATGRQPPRDISDTCRPCRTPRPEQPRQPGPQRGRPARGARGPRQPGRRR